MSSPSLFSFGSPVGEDSVIEAMNKSKAAIQEAKSAELKFGRDHDFALNEVDTLLFHSVRYAVASGIMDGYRDANSDMSFIDYLLWYLEYDVAYTRSNPLSRSTSTTRNLIDDIRASVVTSTYRDVWNHLDRGRRAG